MTENPNYVTESDSFVRHNVKIPSCQPSKFLDAWQYLPKGRSGPHPVIVMAHGFAANKLMGLATYAIAYASAGYACVVFDYRRWGTSDGEPREVIVVSEQLDDYRAVIKYCHQQPEFDSQRVIAWGSSFSGGHAVRLGAEKNLNLAAIMSQCPHLGDNGDFPLSLAFARTLFLAFLDVIFQSLGLSPIYISAMSDIGSVGIIAAPGAVDGITDCCTDRKDFSNKAAASGIFQIVRHKPLRTASQIKCPALIVAPEEDNLCRLEAAVQLSRLSPTVELITPECGHFEVYPRQRGHAETLEAQFNFLKKHFPL